MQTDAPSEAPGSISENPEYKKAKDNYLNEYLKSKTEAVKQIRSKYEPKLKELKSNTSNGKFPLKPHTFQE